MSGPAPLTERVLALAVALRRQGEAWRATHGRDAVFEKFMETAESLIAAHDAATETLAVARGKPSPRAATHPAPDQVM